ncbi:MAG: FecR domain-containing protein, partial [Clostridia bacterium]|nr:FecR domain-containing protein [Clostridia bacterium]
MKEMLKTKKAKISVIVFVITALVVTALTTVLAMGEKSEGYRTIRVIEISGTVGVVHDNMEYSAYTGMHLEEGYSVVTSGNSYIRMVLDDDKYVKLESGSKAVFEELGNGKTAIRIERGSIVSEVTKPLAVDEDFIINTPNAVLAVRGTLFRVDLSRNEKGELNTDVITYGGAVSSKRVQPDGEVEDVEV